MSDTVQEPADRKEVIFVVALLCAGIAFRLLYSWLAAGVLPWNDMSIYDQGRLELLTKGSYSFDYPPVYGLFLAGVTMLFGEGYFKLYAAQGLVSSATCLLLYLIARRCFSRAAGLALLAASAFYADMAWYSSVLMAETVGIFFLTLSVWLSIRKGPSPLGGIAFGLACLTKGVYLISLPALLLWLFLRSDRKAGLKAAAVFAAFAFLTISPWTIRNYGFHKGFVLITSPEGGAMFVGHNPYARGGADFEWYDTDYGRFVSDESISPKVRANMARQKAIDFALANPGREVQLFFLKLSKYWSFRTHFDFNNGPYPYRKWMFLLSIFAHMIIFPAMVLGAIASWRDRDALVSHLVIGINTLIFITLFYASGRMRYQLVPFILLLAGHGLALAPGLFRQLAGPDARQARSRLAWPAAVTLLMFANFVWQALENYVKFSSRF